MNRKLSGMNLLLLAEGVALVLVLVIGLAGGATGAFRDATENSEGFTSNNTENDWQDTAGNNRPSEEDSQGKDTEGNTPSGTEDEQKWYIPEDYEEDRKTFSNSVETMLAGMTTEQKVAQLFVITPEALTGYTTVTAFGNASKEAYDKHPVGGLIYSDRNFQGNAQMLSLVNGAVNYSQQTYGNKVLAFMASNASMEEQIAFAGRTGINVILGNTGDISAIKGASLTPGIVEFPGKANATAGENGLRFSEETFKELCESSFISYQAGIDAGVGIVTVGNVIVESITDDENVVCSLSNRTIGLLRESMKYDGIIMSDDCSEEALVRLYGAETVCVEAIKAGVDMIYKPANFEKAYEAVLAAVRSGDISEDRLNNAVGRILTAKGV